MSDQQPIETIEVPDDISSIPTPNEPAKYRTLLEIWGVILEPAVGGEMREEPISPQWATKMVTTYPGIGFKQVTPIHYGVFALAAELAGILKEEVASDDECLKKASAEEDAEENAGHYRSLLAGWQIHLLLKELEWNPEDDDAAVQLAVLSEVQQMFLGQTGLVAHLDNIGFEFTEDDQAELQQKLQDARALALGLEVSGE